MKLSGRIHGWLIVATLLPLLFLSARSRAQGSDAGTLAYYLSTNAAHYAVGHSPDDTKEVANWSYGEYTNANIRLIASAVWATNFWLYGVKGLSATCIGYSNGMGGQGLVTMVSPRHYLFATHMHPEGYLTAFLGTDNIVYWRKTLERVDLVDDISVGILNTDLPPVVGYLPVLPTNILDYLPVDNTSSIQGIGMNQDMHLFSQPMNFGKPFYVRWSDTMRAPLGLGKDWNVRIRAGDSSDPEMLLIGNQLVLLSHNYAVNAGPDYAVKIDAINEKMHYLSKHNHARTDYQLTVFSLKKWPKLK
jgi:hypothetical protein